MTDAWPGVLERGKWLESLLAAVAAFAATWPVGDLVADRPWTGPLAGTLLLVVVVGALVRTARVPGWVVLLAQLLALLSALSWWVSAQTGEALAVGGAELLGEGIVTIQEHAVPAPATPGLAFIVLTSVALLAWLIDALAVTLRAAALAGVPLLLVTALTASGTGDPLDPRFFLAVAAAWLVLLASQGRTGLREWRAAGAPAEATTVDPRAATRGNERRFGFLARVMGVSALALAVLLPGVLPHLPTTAVLDGLARTGGSTGTVSFTQTLDLAQDLADRSNAPVIRYRTDDTSPPPLRVTVSTDYEDGNWLPAEHREEHLAPITGEEIVSINTVLTESGDIPTTTATMTVTQNGLRSPQLALPHPTTRVDLGEIDWAWDPLNDLAVVDAQSQTYEATFQQLAPLATLPEEIGAPPVQLIDTVDVAEERRLEDGTIYRSDAEGMPLEIVEPDGRLRRPMSDGTTVVTEPDGATSREYFGDDVDVDPVRPDPASGERVAALADEIAGDLTNQIDIATEIQRYLRGPEFTYSLTLAGPVEGPDGEPLDPVSHFLETKQGYCTQFASAMVMMARSQDIPARLAVGFLPGDAGVDGTRTVVAADAHAWPELYINGLGWTRFEPTPGTRSGLAPSYQTPTQTEEELTAAPDPTVGDPMPDTAVPDPGAGQGSQGGTGWFESNGHYVGWTVLGLAALAVVLVILPVAAWWRRERWRLGPDAATRVEGEWSVLRESLADLGVAAPQGATPRALRDHYADELEPDAPTLDALTRATDRLESARYAAGPAALGTMGEDVRRVVAWRRQMLPRRRRLAAWLNPASGRAQLRSLLPGGKPLAPDVGSDPATMSAERA